MLLLACFNNGYTAEMSDELADCRAIQSDAERLTCYDAIGSGREEEQAEEEAVAVAVATEATAKAETPIVETPPAEESFGKPIDDISREPKESASSNAVDGLVATVTEARLYKVGRIMVTLDNGQQWRQTSASTLTLSVGDEIQIQRGAMGSYRLTQVDGTRSMKVRRVD
jgi:hypothetical protein